jgi:hypothetical protein
LIRDGERQSRFMPLCVWRGGWLRNGEARPAQRRKANAMSTSEIERFAADLKSNEALRVEATKHEAEKQHTTPLARAVSFAASKGYSFTVDEAKEHAKAKAAANGKILTDAELNDIAGGQIAEGRFVNH